MDDILECQDIKKIDKEIKVQILLKKSNALRLNNQNLKCFFIPPTTRNLLFSSLQISETSIVRHNGKLCRSTPSSINKENQWLPNEGESTRVFDRKIFQLVLSHNKLSSDKVHHLSFLTDLRDLNLQGNRLTEVPSSVFFLTQLNSLTLSLNELKTVHGIHNLPLLSFLDVSTNQISRLPSTSEISKLIHLETFKASRNELSSFDSLCVLTKLCSLQLSFNRLADISPTIRTLTSLTELDISTNQITNIPKEISFLKNLSLLNLSSNCLMSLPSELCECTSLRELILFKNYIQCIPEQITKLKSLQVLNINHNEITSVPPFDGLFQLRKVNLSHNKITQIHSSLFQLADHSLSILDISDNELVTFPVSDIHLTSTNKLLSFFFHFNYFVTVPPFVRVTYSWEDSIPSQVLDNVFLGGSCQAQNRRGLKTLGITHIINAAYVTPDQYFPEEFAYLILNWEDHVKQPILNDLPKCFEFIEKSTQKGKVFVHCQAGVSRSASVVIAWLMYKRQLNFEEALTIVRRARPLVEPYRDPNNL
jgi:Leucine-rich repeat (LRR) protein